MAGWLKLDTLGTNSEAFPLFRCPGCKQTGIIDKEQYEGIISIQCHNCNYHETKDWSDVKYESCMSTV